MRPFDPYAELHSGITIELIHGQITLDEDDARNTMGVAYSLLGKLPQRIRLFTVRFSPAMSNVGGWHLTGERGTILLPHHVILFEVNNDTRRNELSFLERPKDGHTCVKEGIRVKKFETEALPTMLIDLLRELATEELVLLEGDMMGDLDSVKSFLRDPKVKNSA